MPASYGLSCRVAVMRWPPWCHVAGLPRLDWQSSKILSSRSSRSSEFGLASDGKQRGKKLPTPRDIINSLRCPVDGLISYNEQVPLCSPLAACVSKRSAFGAKADVGASPSSAWGLPGSKHINVSVSTVVLLPSVGALTPA